MEHLKYWYSPEVQFKVATEGIEGARLKGNAGRVFVADNIVAVRVGCHTNIISQALPSVIRNV